MLKPLTNIKAIPLSGGCITRHHKTLLPFGGFSMIQNMRDNHPGKRKRPGQIKLHSTADSTNEVLSLYQFRKNRIDEKHFFAQMSDGDVLEATNPPPTVTTGVFGTEVFNGGTSQIPASWGNLNDIMIYSNGSDQHQIYTGDDNYVEKFVLYKGTAAPPNIPTEGLDYTQEVSDGLTTTNAVLDSLNTYANYECVFVYSPVPVTKLTWTIGSPNANVSTASVYYKKSDDTWADASITDGTESGSASLAIDGSMTWTAPSDEIPSFMYGRSGYWLQVRFSAQLDTDVKITKVTYGSGFTDIVNVWNGMVTPAVEVLVEGTSTYETYGAGAVSLSELPAGKKIMVASEDPLVGIYIDVGKTPNDTGTTLTSLKTWNGSAMVTVGSVTEGSNGISNSGWLTFPRQSTIQPLQFQTGDIYAYWYEIIFDSAIAIDVEPAFSVMPYFDIEELGRSQSNCVWKGRAVYSFDMYGQYVYISQEDSPLVLNGNDYGILKAGDGRTNKVVSMRPFHNELMVFQEEKGSAGGCLTLFQGYTPDTFGKMIINSQIGTFSNKTVDIVSGVLTSTATDERIKDLAFFLSRYGVCVSDGMTISIISDDIQNYFDPTKSECIRRGYEDKMWLKYDSAFNVVRIGLVSGSSAIKPNVFPLFDLVNKTWSFDDLEQELSCLTEVEGGSGNIPVIQVAGGIDDGTIYQSNTGTNDVSTAIDSYLIMELNANGKYIQLDEMIIRAEAVASNPGDITLTITKNDISAGTKTLTLAPERTGQGIRRHRFNLNVQDQNISLKLQNNTADKEMTLLDMGIETSFYEGR